VGFDGLKRTQEYIKKGKVTATIAQDPDMMAQKSVENLLLILSGQKFSTHILISPFIVDLDKIK
jgi:ABC-type sugar transport system substrate-binding protein